jgi:hypothetical protein
MFKSSNIISQIAYYILIHFIICIYIYIYIYVIGVVSVALEGQDKDQVVVIGNEVDVSCLTSSLRKKVGHATIVSVEEVKPKPKPDEKKKEDTSKKKVEDKDKKCGTEIKCSCPTPLCACPPPCYQSQLVFYDRDPYQQPCTIM